MKIQCLNCKKEFKIADPKKLDEGHKTFAFKCLSCGHREVLTKEDGETWATHLGRRSHWTALPKITPGIEAVESVPAVKKETVVKTAVVDCISDTIGLPDVLAGDGPKRRSMLSGLTGKVALFMLLASLLPLSIYAVVMNYAAVQRMEGETDQGGQQITAALSNQIEEWIDKNLRILQAAADLAELKVMTASSQEPVLKAIAAHYPWKYLVFTVNTAGMNIARSDGNPVTDYSDRQYYQDVVQNKKPFAWQTLIGRTTKKPALILAVPIKKEGQVVGALCSAMHVEAISEQIANWRKGKTGLAFLVDQTGKVVAHQNAEFTQMEKFLGSHPLIANFHKDNLGMQRFQENGVSKIGFVRATQWNWKVAIQQDEEEVFALIRQANLFAICILAIAVALVLVVALVSSRAIVRPIRVLTDAADRISTGDLEVRIDIRAENEIGELAAAIGRMQESIRLAIERMKRTRSRQPLPLKNQKASATESPGMIS